ncbi:hypothetical protein C4B60_06295 [Jeotgalibacillus proteolyticus]|uniref:Uncharacterized protein n=1 Tax=Jeotgalibacillus proteolyticus TaxID=2082395 RepID=A0A2S5GF37_9BACL|nr:hypothetical protein C4B60_06295 [Jeotgalibacillus proteolyticus]
MKWKSNHTLKLGGTAHKSVPAQRKGLFLCVFLIKSGSRRLGATSIRQPAQIGAFCLLGRMTYDSSPCLLELDIIKSGNGRLAPTDVRRSANQALFA